MATKMHKKAQGATQEGGCTVEMIETKRIIPTRDNPRRVDVKAAAFKELVASVQARGILVPLLGRPDPKRAGMIDLRAGARRFAAAVEAKLSTVPVIVREMDDVEAMEVTVLENLQREDLTPMEEARGIAKLRSINKSDSDIAEKLGKSPAWVRRRAQLLKLDEKIAQSWEDQEDGMLRGASIAVMELVASFPVEVQRLMARDFPDWMWAEESEFRNRVEEKYRRLLSKMPWDLEDGKLVAKAGPCSGCPFRSSVEPLLFHETLDAEEVRAGDTCLKPECYRWKMDAHLAKREAAARREFPALVKVSARDEYQMGYDEAQKAHKEGVLLGGTWKKVKAKAPGAVPALVVDGPGAGGDVIYVSRVEAGRSRSDGKEEQAPEKSLEDKRKLLSGRRLILAMERVSELLEASIHPAEDSRLEYVARLVSIFGARMPAEVFEVEGDDWPDLRAEAKVAEFDVVQRLWTMMKPVLQQEYLNTSAGPSFVARAAEQFEAGAAGVCKLIGADWAQLVAEAVEKIPEPKSWMKKNGQTTEGDV